MTEPSSSSSSSSRSWSWSDASQDLLQLILKFLTPLNYLRFGSVCRSWRIAQRECLHPPAQDLPFHINNDEHGESIELYSFSEKKIYKKPLQRGFTFAYSIPYSRGWLVLYDTNHKIDFLFNPFIANGCIDLPKQERKCYDECFFCSTPAHPDGTVLLLQSARNNKFLPCRLNPRSDHQYYEWQEPFIASDWDKDTCPVVSSIIFFQGKLYALNEDCGLSVVDTLFPHDFTVLKMKLESTDSAHSAPPVEWHHHAVIVESCGEMLLVLRVGEFWNCFVAVYRANLTELEWVKVENLGDRAILIFNQRSSVSVCTIETDFRSNWVYYLSHISNKGFSVRFTEFELGGDGIQLFEGPTDDESSVTDDDEHGVTDDDEHGETDDEYCVTDDDKHGVTDDDEHGVTDDDQHGVTDDDKHGVTDDDEYGVTDDDNHGVTDDEYNVTDDDEHGVTDDDEHGVTDDDDYGVPAYINLLLVLILLLLILCSLIIIHTFS